MRRALTLSAALLGPAAFGAASLPAAAPAQTASPDFTWSEVIAPGTTVLVANVNGSITAAAAPSKAGGVKAHIYADDGNVRGVHVVTKRWGKTIAFCTVYPGDEVGEDCSTRNRDAQRDRNDHVHVDYTLTVPAATALRLRSVNGSVNASGMAGPVDARSVNGGVTIATSGAANAKVVNGHIEVRLGAAAWSGTLAFDSVNGSVRVYLPRNANFTLDAKSLNGSIDASPFGLRETGEHFVGHRLEGTVGGGGRALDIKTVNGSIAVLSSGKS